MTIQEAIKSELPYRRRGWETESWLPANRSLISTMYSIEDILADDWEVKREPREFRLYNCPVLGKVWVEANESAMTSESAMVICAREVID